MHNKTNKTGFFHLGITTMPPHYGETNKQGYLEWFQQLNEAWESTCPIASQLLVPVEIKTFATDDEGYHRFAFESKQGVTGDQFQAQRHTIIKELNALFDDDPAPMEPNYHHTETINFRDGSQIITHIILVPWSC